MVASKNKTLQLFDYHFVAKIYLKFRLRSPHFGLANPVFRFVQIKKRLRRRYLRLRSLNWRDNLPRKYQAVSGVGFSVAGLRPFDLFFLAPGTDKRLILSSTIVASLLPLLTLFFTFST